MVLPLLWAPHISSDRFLPFSKTQTICFRHVCELGTTRVVEIDVDAFGGALLQVVQGLALQVIEGVIHLEFVAQESDFVMRTGTGEHSATVHFSQLACGGANPASPGRDKNGFRSE